jgi:outer membrane receptor for ferrienterochelin and colicins
MNLKLALIGLFFLTGTRLLAQVTLHIIDDEIGAPVSGATIWVTGLGNEEQFFEITTDEGYVSVPVALPFVYQVQHVAFETHTDTVFQHKDIQVAMKGAVSELEEVVITGQFAPSSAKKSVYQVRTIGEKRIASQAATSIQDVLSRELNIRFNRDNAVGSSNIILQGLSGQNVKILLDGVPLVGRSGVANEIDLSQIDINSIARVEIVEGPMSVNYGSDALAGVINLITKKDARQKVDLKLNIQEETIGNEYSMVEDGIHDYSLTSNIKPGENWYLRLNTRRKRFGGWIGDEDDADERDKLWYPKTQWFQNAMIRYQAKNWLMSYQTNLMNENIFNLGSPIDGNPLKDPTAIDEDFVTQRWMHALDWTREFRKASWNTVMSYTNYQRTTSQYVRNLVTDQTEPTGIDEQDTIRFHNVFMRSLLTDPVRYQGGNLAMHTQFGIETTYETAEGTTISSGQKDQFNIAVFGSAELAWSDLKIRPGVRLIHNSVYPSIPTPSLNLKYQVNRTISLRMGYGRGYRAPSVKELYHEFIDSNHHLVGNESLKPEYSHNITGNISYEAKNGLNITATSFYNHIDNRITYFTPETSNQATSYVNLEIFKTTGASIAAKHIWRQLTWQLGASSVGRYQELSDDQRDEVPEFVYSPEFNTVLNYQITSLDLTVNLFAKYTGATKQYQLITEGEASVPALVSVDGYSFVDFTLIKGFGQSLSASAGVKNLFDVTRLAGGVSGSAHGASSSVVSYGRSFFVRLNFNLINNK